MKTLRKWATPLVVGSTLMMAVTGVLMFFHLETTLGKVLHEWAGWVMVAGIAAHLILNWRAFTTYFKRPMAMGIMGVGGAVLALSFVPIGPDASTGDLSRTAMMTLSGGQIETLAALTGSETGAVLEKLGAAGIEASATDTPQSLSGGNRMQQMTILSTILAE